MQGYRHVNQSVPVLAAAVPSAARSLTELLLLTFVLLPSASKCVYQQLFTRLNKPQAAGCYVVNLPSEENCIRCQNTSSRSLGLQYEVLCGPSCQRDTLLVIMSRKNIQGDTCPAKPLWYSLGKMIVIILKKKKILSSSGNRKKK